MGYLAAVAQAVWAHDPARQVTWLDEQRRELLTGDPDRVLARVRAVQAAQPPASPVWATITTSLSYREKRRAPVPDAAFTAAGYPLGSGAVESATTRVVEARLKGAGMHWAPAPVSPMAARRTITCSDRWADAWPPLGAQQRQQAQVRATARRQARADTTTAASASPSPTPGTPAVALPAGLALPPDRHAPDDPPSAAPASSSPCSPEARRPAADHPWRRRLLRPRRAA